MENVIVNGENYIFISNYKHDSELRYRFNALTQQVYQFDFEKWYDSGYWADNCLLYSLMADDKVVSHITVSVIDFIILGEHQRFVQLGTVMTDEQYRNQGLSRVLLEKVLEEWTSKCDMIYLYANDSVLDFYPKFGFVPVDEYQASAKITTNERAYAVRKMDMESDSDRKLLYETAKHTVGLFDITMQDNAGLVMFYSHYFDPFSVKDNLFYIEELNAIAVAEVEGITLIVYDVLATRNIEIEEVLNALASEGTEDVILRCMPVENEEYEISLFKEEDSTLMVMADKKEIFQHNKLIFPMLSHT